MLVLVSEVFKAMKCLVLPDDGWFGGMMVRYVPVRLVGLVK